METIRRDLQKHIAGKKITQILAAPKKNIISGSLNAFKKKLLRNRIENLERRGKLLYGHLRIGGDYLLIHLKMTGQLVYRHNKQVISGGHPQDFSSDELPNKYSHVVFTFADKSHLFFNDQRQFGYMKIASPKELDKILSAYGIEPLTSGFTLPAFRKIMANKKASVKAVLLNQKYIAGIGNIYADEICFAARVAPEKQADKLTDEEIKNLYKASASVIKKAISKRGTTFRDYRDSAGQAGNFVKYLKVYGRAGKKCQRCGYAFLKKAKITGRGTVFCPTCQK